MLEPDIMLVTGVGAALAVELQRWERDTEPDGSGRLGLGPREGVASARGERGGWGWAGGGGGGGSESR